MYLMRKKQLQRRGKPTKSLTICWREQQKKPDFGSWRRTGEGRSKSRRGEGGKKLSSWSSEGEVTGMVSEMRRITK